MSDNDILDRAKAALEGTTEGPWGTDGELIGSELTVDAPGVTSYKHAIAQMETDYYAEEDAQEDETYGDDEPWRPYEQMTADAEFIAQARTLIPELIAEVETLRRGGKELGRIIESQCQMVLNITGLHDVIDEDGDGDWGLVWEKLAELGTGKLT